MTWKDQLAIGAIISFCLGKKGVKNNEASRWNSFRLIRADECDTEGRSGNGLAAGANWGCGKGNLEKISGFFFIYLKET